MEVKKILQSIFDWHLTAHSIIFSKLEQQISSGIQRHYVNSQSHCNRWHQVKTCTHWCSNIEARGKRGLGSRRVDCIYTTRLTLKRWRVERHASASSRRRSSRHCNRGRQWSEDVGGWWQRRLSSGWIRYPELTFLRSLGLASRSRRRKLTRSMQPWMKHRLARLVSQWPLYLLLHKAY